MPISPIDHADTLIWHFDKSGSYIVRSGYRRLTAKEINLAASRPQTSQVIHLKVWIGVWKLKVQQKIQNFIWKLMHNVIPILDNLFKKGIPLDHSCPICKEKISMLAEDLL